MEVSWNRGTQMDDLPWKIPIEMDDDWGYPNFRKPPREGRNRRHGQPFSSHGHAGQENCENCEPPLKKVKESKPELIGKRAWKSYFGYDNAKRIHGFKNDLRAGSIRDMTITSVNLGFCPRLSMVFHSSKSCLITHPPGLPRPCSCSNSWPARCGSHGKPRKPPPRWRCRAKFMKRYEIP